METVGRRLKGEGNTYTYLRLIHVVVGRNQHNVKQLSSLKQLKIKFF